MADNVTIVQDLVLTVREIVKSAEISKDRMDCILREILGIKKLSMRWAPRLLLYDSKRNRVDHTIYLNYHYLSHVYLKKSKMGMGSTMPNNYTGSTSSYWKLIGSFERYILFKSHNTFLLRKLVPKFTYAMLYISRFFFLFFWQMYGLHFTNKQSINS